MTKLRVGIIGAGHIAGNMARTLREMDTAECYGIASRSFEKADSFAKEFGVTKAFGSYAELLQDENVDLVYIATPHSEHHRNMMECLSYKKAILCEKPFTVNAKEAREVLDLAKELNILVAEAMWIRYLPMAETLKEVLDSGIIGDLRMVTGNLCYNIENNERMTNPSLAGGALLDVGVYPLNWASMILGADITDVESSCQYHATGVDRQNSITLHYKNGSMAVLNSAMNCIGDRIGSVYGTKGHVVVQNINNFESITVFDQGYHVVRTEVRPEQITGFEYQVEACRQALLSGETECSEMPHSEIIRIMELMDDLRRSWGVKYPFE